MNGSVDAQGYKAQMVLVPQRKGYGLCGMPSLLFVDAWLDRYGRKWDFLTANHQDKVVDTSRINTYLVPGFVPRNTSLRAASLPPCPGAQWECVQFVICIGVFALERADNR